MIRHGGIPYPLVNNVIYSSAITFAATEALSIVQPTKSREDRRRTPYWLVIFQIRELYIELLLLINELIN